MTMDDYIRVEKPIIDNFIKIKEALPALPNLPSVSKVVEKGAKVAGKVIEKSILPLIGICFLADWYSTNNFM